jgi:hypothetical protein
VTLLLAELDIPQAGSVSLEELKKMVAQPLKARPGSWEACDIDVTDIVAKANSCQSSQHLGNYLSEVVEYRPGQKATCPD